MALLGTSIILLRPLRAGPRDFLRVPARAQYDSADLIAQKTAEALECTFAPRVEPKSIALAQRIRTGAPIHEELYARQAEHDQVCNSA